MEKRMKLLDTWNISIVKLIVILFVVIDCVSGLN